MIKDKRRYVTVVATYRRGGSSECWECEQSRIVPFKPGEIWNDRKEAEVERLAQGKLRIKVAFRVEPQGKRYIPLIPLPVAQDAADRAFRAAMPGARLKSVNQPTDTGPLNV